MANYEKQLGNRGYGRWGRAAYLQSSGTDMKFVTFSDFTGGLSGANSREDTPPTFTPNALDTYVTANDRLAVAPGTVLVENLVRQNLSSIDYSTYPDGAPAGHTHYGLGTSVVASGKLTTPGLANTQVGGATVNGSQSASGTKRVAAKLSLVTVGSSTGGIPAGGIVLNYTDGSGSLGFLGFRMVGLYNRTASSGNANIRLFVAAGLVSGSSPSLVDDSFILGRWLTVSDVVVVEGLYTPGVGAANGTFQYRVWIDGLTVPAFRSASVGSAYAALSGPSGIADFGGENLGSNTQYVSLSIEADPSDAAPRRVALHTALDYTSDLVLFDAPFLGVKHVGATEWFDAGLPTGRPYTWTNFGGTLLFSNGETGMYAKERGELEVSLVEGAPAARAYASFAGRVFAGHGIIDGNREPLGISWSAASSNHEDWEHFNSDGAATGAGFELLIDDMAAGDSIVALRPMGLDFMAVMLRHSIWIARRTGNVFRPAEFQPRVPGVGAINAECCKTTRFGVIFLADGPGIYLFNGNTADFIGDAITSQLQTLTREQLLDCTAEYNPLNRCYYLFTAIGTFVYDFERKRWHKRSLIAYGAATFATQIAEVTWAEITGSWAEQTDTWQDLNPEEADDHAFFFLGTRGVQTALDKEDAAATSNFGTALTPSWEFPLQEGLYMNQLVTTKLIEFNYEGTGTITCWLPGNNGQYATERVVPLVGVGQLTKVAFGEHTGKGAGLRLVFTSGKPEILRVQLGVILRGPRIESVS